MTTKKQEVRKVPNLRFSEFGGEWERKKLGEVVDFKITNSFSRENLNYEVGTVKNIHYGDIHTKFQTLFDITKEQVPFVNENVFIGRISEDNYCKEGDIIFADASENLDDVGKSIEIVNLNNEKLLSGLHTLLARPKKNFFYKGFSGYLFRSNDIRLKIQKEAQGSKVLSISTSRMTNIELTFPTLKEQQKIASFLSLIDERIQKSIKIIEGLKSFKNAVSKKIFSQELRFKDENGEEFEDWEEENGGDIFENISNKNHNSDLPILAISQEFGAVPREMINYQISVTDKSIESYKVVEIGDFIISLRSFQGGIEYSNYKGICSPAYVILRAKTLIDNTFYKYYFKTDFYIQQLCSKLEGIRDGKMISYKYFSEITLPFPPLAEQNKIADFLTGVDEKIELETSLLQQLKLQKQYFLQQMFI
jgi:type I restriction enzyme S subunit